MKVPQTKRPLSQRELRCFGLGMDNATKVILDLCKRELGEEMAERLRLALEQQNRDVFEEAT